MDSFDVKLEKANAISRYRRLQKLTLVFRLVEFFVFLIMISKISSQMLPLAFKFSQFSSEYFQGLYASVFSPRFVFIIGNAIIVILFIKSGQLSSGREISSNSSKVDFYDEYVKSCHRTSETIIHNSDEEGRKMCRSRSENYMMMRENHDETQRKLRRSLTSERSQIKSSIGCVGEMKVAEVKGYAEDELSNEEFRRTVEAFIARQQKSLRDEEFAPIVYLEP